MWVRLGELSFAFYMCHSLVLEYGSYLLHGGKGFATGFSTPVAIVVFVLLFAVTVGLAYLLFRFVEDPIMRNWARPRRKSLVPVATPQVDGQTPEGRDLAA
jgi:peptidoglycan/LPS O-acetylase OafA/YrhL